MLPQDLKEKAKQLFGSTQQNVLRLFSKQSPLPNEGQPSAVAPHHEMLKNSAAVVVFVIIGFICSAFLFKVFNKAPASQPSRSAPTKAKNVPNPAQLATGLQQAPQASISPKAAPVPPALHVRAKKTSLKKTTLPPLLLNGISASKTGDVALINNRLLHEGETIDGARVITIDPTKVELDFEGQTIVLRVR